MKKIKCLLNRCALFATVLLVCLGFSSDAQYAGVVDTTFRPNANGVPFNQLLNPGYVKVNGVEIIDDSIYYAFSTSIGGVSKIKKYDLHGNEDINYLNNQLSTWQNGFSTICIEPELDSNLVKIDLDYLSKGVYIVVLTTDKGIEKRKIIK